MLVEIAMVNFDSMVFNHFIETEGFPIWGNSKCFWLTA